MRKGNALVEFCKDHQIFMVISTLSVGVLTALLLYWTLKMGWQTNQDNFKPVLIPYSKDSEFNISDLIVHSRINDGSTHLTIQIPVKNVGKGSALNVRIQPMGSIGQWHNFPAVNPISIHIGADDISNIGFAFSSSELTEVELDEALSTFSLNRFFITYDDIYNKNYELNVTLHKGKQKDFAFTWNMEGT